MDKITTQKAFKINLAYEIHEIAEILRYIVLNKQTGWEEEVTILSAVLENRILPAVRELERSLEDK